MSLSAVPSRFSVLPDDDADEAKVSNREKKKQERRRDKEAAAAAEAAKKKAGKKKKADDQHLKAMAFGLKNKNNNNAAPSASGSNKKNKKQAKRETPDAFDEWKEKDAKVVDEIYRGDLERALLESKIEFEQGGKTAGDETGQSPSKTTTQPASTKQKPVALSLEQFHSLGTEKREASTAEDARVSDRAVTQEEDDFFERLERDALNVLSREKRLDELRRSCNAGVSGPKNAMYGRR